MRDLTDKLQAGSTYEDFMGRWSRLLAPPFVSLLPKPSGAHCCGSRLSADTLAGGQTSRSSVASRRDRVGTQRRIVFEP